jgi:hypothetical protein
MVLFYFPVFIVNVSDCFKRSTNVCMRSLVDINEMFRNGESKLVIGDYCDHLIYPFFRITSCTMKTEIYLIYLREQIFSKQNYDTQPAT